MKKLLLLLMTFLALTPPLRAENQQRSETIFYSKTVPSNATAVAVEGNVYLTYYSYINQEEKTVLLDTDTYAEANLQINTSLNILRKLEYEPKDGNGDRIIIEFDDSEMTEISTQSTSAGNISYKKAAWLTDRGITIGPKCKIHVHTKYADGKFNYLAFDFSGKLIDAYFSNRAEWSNSRLLELDGNPIWNVAERTWVSNYDQIVRQYNASYGTLYVTSNSTYIHSVSLRFETKQPNSFGIVNTCNDTGNRYLVFTNIPVQWTPGTPPTPVVQDVEVNTVYGFKEDNIIRFSKDVKLNNIISDLESDYYYVFSNGTPADEVELIEANKLTTDNAPTFNQSGWLSVVAVSKEYKTVSPVRRFQLIKLNNLVLHNLAEAQKEQYNNNIVTFSCPLLIEGIQNTQNNAKFMYVRDPQGNAIKFVNNGSDIFFNNKNHYEVGQEIPAYGITGVYRHTEGWPQVEVYVGPGDDYRRYSADASEVTTDFGDYDPARKTFGADDFNRHVIVNNLTWTGHESKFTDSEGNSLNAYGRFTAYQGILSGLTSGRTYNVEGFIGQIKGEPTLFPTKVSPEIVLLAPNPIVGEKDADGWIDVNVISDEVSIKMDPTCVIEGATYMVKRNDADAYQWANLTGYLDIKGNQFVNGIYKLIVYATVDGEKAGEIKIRFTKRAVTKEFATLAEFNTEFRDASDTPKPNTSKTLYYKFTGHAEVRAVTPKYLYLRDADCAEGQESISSLLLYNENGWEGAVTNRDEATSIESQGGRPVVGDILTNFALIPDRTHLDNLRGYATNFARTLRRTQDGTGIAPTPKTKASDEAFDDDDRMVRYIVENVTVSRDDKGVYTLDMPGNPVLNIGSVFGATGGWATAWDPTVPFNIEGIVLRNGESGYALAFYDFTAGTRSPAMAVPTLQGVEDTDLSAGLSFATTAKVELKLADASATAEIYYTTDGSDPLNNPAKRKLYDGPFEISSTTTVKAYAAVAGAMPSAVVERTFTRTTSDRRYIINFLNQGQPEEMYNFTGTVAVAAIGREYMFVRGAVGHYLPVKLTADGASWTDKGYAVGDHLTGFMLGYHEEGAEGAVNRMGRVADAATLATWGAAITPDAGETIDVTSPEETSAISAANARRMVTVKGVHISRGTAKADTWTMTEANGEGATYALVPGVLGADMSAVTGEGQQFDITGFVMYGADGALEVWPMSISRLTPAANVAVTIDGKPAGATAEFTSNVKLEFSCPTPGAVIQYQFYNENSDPEPERWYTYEGRPVVIDESCRLHARATAPGFAVGNHTHLDLVRLDQTAAPSISVAEGTESSTVTISAEAGTVISWWTSENATARVYTAPIAIEATTIVYATAKAEGKVESPVTHRLVKVTGSAAPSDKVSGKVNISARLNDEGKPVVTIAPADANLAPDSYTIYYTLKEGVVLTPENGTKYTGEFVMEESGLVTAILVESGKSAGEPCYLNVWAGLTGIDGISGAEDESAVRVDGDSIIAPEGSEVYDLSGRRVNPAGLAGGIYIVRVPGGKSIKVRV